MPLGNEVMVFIQKLKRQGRDFFPYSQSEGKNFIYSDQDVTPSAKLAAAAPIFRGK